MKSSSRNGVKPKWVVVHTAEGARTVAALRNFFNRADAQGSSHAGCDDNLLEEGWVPYDRAAWTLRNGDEESDNLEACGFASWSRAEWLLHLGMLNNIATWIRRRCQARGIPMVKIGAADVAAGKAGVIGHVDYTNGTGDGTHWDPGPGFPWDVVMAMARGEQGFLMALTDEQQAAIHYRITRIPVHVEDIKARVLEAKNTAGTAASQAAVASTRAAAAEQAAKAAAAKADQLGAVLAENVGEAIRTYLSANPPTVTVDYAQLAKAVNDDHARRMAE